MTVNTVMQAALYLLTTIGAVSAFAVALLGSTAAFERWLDADASVQVRDSQSVPLGAHPAGFDSDAHPTAA